MVKKYEDLSKEDYEHESASVDGETTYFKTATTENPPQDYNDLDNEDNTFIKDCLDAADYFLRTFLSDSNIDNYTPASLDELIDQWNSDNAKFKCSQDYFVYVIGFAFGQYLVKTYNMKWTKVTDEYGTDYATTIKELKFTNFPINSILKAIEKKREASLNAISLMNKHHIAELLKGD